MPKDEEELEDEAFDDVAEQEDEENSTDAEALDDDESEDEFLQSSVDADDLASGYSTTVPAREVDVDEDTEGDDVTDAGDEKPMTEVEVDDAARDAAGRDEIELDLDVALTTGATTTEAPEGD